MKESIGYTVSLNLIIVFITIIIGFLSAALIYFKSNKVSNIITSAIEKYEGYNTNAKEEINRNLTSLGYASHTIECGAHVDEDGTYTAGGGINKCEALFSSGTDGYCVYICYEENNFPGSAYRGDYYYYKIRTNMMVNVPVINNLIDIPIYSNTIRLYNYLK